MKLKSLGANQTEVEIGNTTVLFSYETPVAACVDGMYLRTSTKYSNTTSRHVNAWLHERGATAQLVEQAQISTLVEEAK